MKLQMQRVKVFQLIYVTMGLISVVLSQPPLYSSQYAKVLYQPQYNSEKAELNLKEVHREEVTEVSGPTRNAVRQDGSNLLATTKFTDVTTEPDSEQIGFAKFRQQNIQKGKLEAQNKESLEQTAKQVDIKPTLEIPVQIGNEEINTSNEERQQEDNIDADIETLDYPVGTELDDLNSQRAYYIIHPNGLFQKVVYKTFDDAENVRDSTNVHYGHIEPIIEPVYTYDPRTFVFQRLVLSATVL